MTASFEHCAKHHKQFPIGTSCDQCDKEAEQTEQAEQAEPEDNANTEPERNDEEERKAD